MLLCWQDCPEDRPTFEQLYLILHEILNTKAVRKIMMMIINSQLLPFNHKKKKKKNDRLQVMNEREIWIKRLKKKA